MGRGAAWDVMSGWDRGTARILPEGYPRALKRALFRVRVRHAVSEVVTSLVRNWQLSLSPPLAVVLLVVLEHPRVGLGLGGLVLALTLVAVYLRMTAHDSERRALAALDRATGAAGDPLRTLVSVADSGGALDAAFRASLVRLFRVPPRLTPKAAAPLSSVSVMLVVLGLLLGVLLPLKFPASEHRADGGAPRNTRRAEERSLLLAEVARAEERFVREAAGQRGGVVPEEFAEVRKLLSDPNLDRESALLELEKLLARLEAEESRRLRFVKELAARGSALRESSVTEGLAEAFESGDPREIEKELARLAERMQDERDGLSEKELDELRKALEAARKEREAEEKSAEAARAAERRAFEETAKDLRGRKERGESLSEAEKNELSRAERKLEELERRKKENEIPKELSALDKRLAELAQELERLRKKAGSKEAAKEFLDRARAEAKSLSSGELGDDQKRRLIEELKRLKEKLEHPEANQGGEGNSEERPGGKGPGQGAGNVESGVPISVPVPGSGNSGAKPGGSEGESGEPSEGAEEMGRASSEGIGANHSPEDLLGEATKASGATDDTFAAGKDAGKGGSESETIRAAARSGFSKRSYRDLYHKYESVMEETLGRETIPPGRRREVARYFDLIRPRSTAESK